MKLCLIFMLITAVNCELSKEYMDIMQETLLMEDVVDSKPGQQVDAKEYKGFWKCGNCSDMDESRLAYTEDNDYGDYDQTSVDIEITLSMSSMRCVTVSSDRPRMVKQLTGACDGPSVTLSVSPAGHFSVQVYN